MFIVYVINGIKLVEINIHYLHEKKIRFNTKYIVRERANLVLLYFKINIK